MTDIIIVFCYLLITLVLGIWVGNKVGTKEDYQTGGRNYPAWIVFTTLSASYIGGGFTIGFAEKTYLYGIAFIVAVWGFSLKEILIGWFIAPRMQSFQNVLTVGDIMGRAYGKRAKIITGVASVLVCGGIIGAQLAACGSILHTFLGPPPAIGALLAGGIVIIYATLGGLKSVVAVDVLHFVVFTLVIPLVLFFGIQEIGGLSPFIQSLPESHLNALSTFDLKTLAVLFISFFLGETLIPPYMQRLLIGRTFRETKRGTLWSGFYSIFFFLTIGCIGMVALILAPNISPAFALPYLIQTVMPIGLKGMAIAALFAVIMSSVDSFLNSISITFSQDILIPLGLIGKSKNKDLLLYRSITLIIGVVAIIISLSTSNSIDILLYSYQFWTPFILTPLIAAIFGVQSSDKTFLISAVTGVAGVIIWNTIDPYHSTSIEDGALVGTIFGVVLNGLTFIICHRYFRTSESKDHLLA